jgi:glycosyltransferase involved in cell wall biosynthesis
MLQLVRERAPQAALVYDMVDAHGLREKRRSSLDGGHIDLSAQALRELELLLVRHADMTLAISDDERDLMGGAAPGATIVTIPNVHDAPESPSTFAERAGLLFVGSWNHPPNRDAISHLIGELMPVVRARLPDVGLTIVGSDVPARIAEGEAGVEVLGWLPDLGEIFDRVRLSVAPLRYGAGLKGKVGDSLVRGVPVVTTSVGAEGFDAGSAQGLAVADRVDGFVDEIVNLYTDEDRWTQMARAGRAGTLAVYGYGAVRDRLADALTQAMSARR